MSKVGFLGLGAMGSRMAANILKAGHTVTVWNRSPEAAEALVASGARRASSPKEAAEGCWSVIPGANMGRNRFLAFNVAPLRS